MNFSFSRTSTVNSLKIKQIKTWIHEALQLDEEISISLSQLKCTEPGCPPVETVIIVMASTVQQYKIHKPIEDIQYVDICNLLTPVRVS
ncbi:hypothetical protein NIES4071_101080 (plasmid) [Calothrix sp. NIES-4071]|nr:hypothetical protein NIES4071_101080 [Calothrix sp. NIES-4071]BAZ64489.1 hypothetical protein NIES4105_102220 [Calothrix sp. NIES-4105]